VFNTGMHQAPLEMFNDMTEYLADCPLDYILDKFKDGMKGGFCRRFPRLCPDIPKIIVPGVPSGGTLNPSW
jgi:hypothetical protein